MSTLLNMYCKYRLTLCGFLNYLLKKEQFLNLSVVKFNTLFCSLHLVLLCPCLPQGQEEIVMFFPKFFLFSL